LALRHCARLSSLTTEAGEPVGFLRNLFGHRSEARPVHEAHGAEVRAAAADDGLDLIELEIVGESYRQDALALIAGPKDTGGKQFRVGVTLRCEPTNQYDSNAVRVEAFGQHVGYVSRPHAQTLCPPLLTHFGGALEARGLIVGGWTDTQGDGAYGIRVWITTADVERLAVDPAPFEPPPRTRPVISMPAPSAGERRLTPSPDDAWALPTTVAVTCEQHYQDVIVGSRPQGWSSGSWPVIVELQPSVNPHARAAEPCVEVRIAGSPVGYLTNAMSQRHGPSVEAALREGLRPTALAEVLETPKAGRSHWQLKLSLAMPADTPVTYFPAKVVNTRTGIKHSIGQELPDGSWRTGCGLTVAAGDVRILCYSRPSGRIVDQRTLQPVAETYASCERC
jgi:hypothetical protein